MRTNIPSRTTSIQEGGDDEDISAAVTPVATPTSVMPSGPITRARARQINGQVLSFLYKYDLANEDIILRSYSDLLVLRNKGEIKDEDSVHSDQMEQHSCMHVTSHPCTCMKCTKGLGLRANITTWVGLWLSATPPGAWRNFQEGQLHTTRSPIRGQHIPPSTGSSSETFRPHHCLLINS